MVNEAPKTIASFARNRLCALRARLLSVGLRKVFECGRTLAQDHVARGEEASSPNRYAKNNVFGRPSSRVRLKIEVRRISAEDARCIESQPVATVTPYFHNFS